MANLQSRFISKQVVKPSSPTPPHLKTYNLSFSDQFAPPSYIPLIFFYPYSGSNDTVTTHQDNACKILKKSLSQTLTQYYPFSGNLVYAPDGSYVDCNDEGVDFLEARVNAKLSQAVAHPHYHLQEQHFFPPGTIWGSTYNNNSLVIIQLTYFECGGLALAVCLSHKIGDLCTLCTFIKHWAAVSQNQYQQQQSVLLLQPLPPQIISSPKIVCGEVKLPEEIKCVSKRFIFPNSKIKQLKAQVGGITNPTRVEVVTSLLYLCAASAVKANRISFYKMFILAQTVNMRRRMANPLQETVMGNLSWCLQVVTTSKTQLGLESLTDRIQKAKSNLATTISEMDRQKSFRVSKFIPTMLFEIFLCTSLCGYQVYRDDFGWGKPIRVSFPGLHQYFILMDTPDEDGIEAVVYLREEDMDKFEADDQLLAFASPA